MCDHHGTVVHDGEAHDEKHRLGNRRDTKLTCFEDDDSDATGRMKLPFRFS